MTVAVWVGVGWLLVSLCTAVAARLDLGHVMPDAAVITMVFLALQREPLQVALGSALLGYLSGRQALAPVGLHEAAAVLSAMSVYLVAGSLAGSGPRFFALASGGAVMLYHVLIWVFAWLGGDGVAFASWPTALLVPSAVATGLFALILYPGLLRLERRLRPENREELSWR